MNRSALILAAHGSQHEPCVNSQIRTLADAIAGGGFFDEVAVAFHQGDPPFSRALDGLSATQAVVVPLMTSEGYYSEVVLPRELAKNPRAMSGECRIHLTRPVGTHSAMIELVADRVRALLNDNALDPATTSVAIVGHGTQRHANSRRATVRLAEHLRDRAATSDVFPAFLDDEPPLESVFHLAKHRNIVCVLFLIGAGPHATRDVPERLGLGSSADSAWPVVGRAGDRLIICDAPIGADPHISNIVLKLTQSPHFTRIDDQPHGESRVSSAPLNRRLQAKPPAPDLDNRLADSTKLGSAMQITRSCVALLEVLR